MKYLLALLQGLVTYPEHVRILETKDDMGILLSINVHDDDMGKIIGREGGTAKAIRLIMANYGSRNRQTIKVSICEPDEFDKKLAGEVI